ncbi:hypothetical protein [Corynebacterium glutamicum]
MAAWLDAYFNGERVDLTVFVRDSENWGD